MVPISRRRTGITAVNCASATSVTRRVGKPVRHGRLRWGWKVGPVVVAAAVLLPVTAGYALKDQTLLISAMPGVAGVAANDASDHPAMSANGRFIVFESHASNLAPDDPDRTQDIFRRDVEGATTTLVSRASGTLGAKGNGASLSADISPDGRYVVFASAATNLDPADTDAAHDIFLRDLQGARRRSSAAPATGQRPTGPRQRRASPTTVAT